MPGIGRSRSPREFVAAGSRTAAAGLADPDQRSRCCRAHGDRTLKTPDAACCPRSEIRRKFCVPPADPGMNDGVPGRCGLGDLKRAGSG
jgi:hypothetical protein